MSGKKSTGKSICGGGIKSFFVSKATPQSKANEVSPQSAASEENCIDLRNEDRTEKKQEKSKTPEPNLFFMNKVRTVVCLCSTLNAND